MSYELTLTDSSVIAPISSLLTPVRVNELITLLTMCLDDVQCPIRGGWCRRMDGVDE